MPMERIGQASESTSLLVSNADSLWLNSSRRSAMLATPAGFQSTSSPIPRIPVTAPPIPTARAPTGSRRNSAPSDGAPPVGGSWAAEKDGPASAARVASAAALERFSLIYQQHRDTVVNSVPEPAGIAQKDGFLRPVFQFANALRAGQYLQQRLVERFVSHVYLS